MTAERVCPTCLGEVPAETFVGPGRPAPSEGDRLVCAWCGAISIFEADGSLRFPTDEELTKSLADARVKQARALRSLWLQ